MNDIIYSNIVEINSSGLVVKQNNSDIFICFDECAKNYAKTNFLKTSNCVADRDITKLTFTFYTNPKIKVVFKKRLLKNIFVKKSKQFIILQKEINKYGYTTFDLS